MNNVKSGYNYHVWGTSNDPSTWFEQNTTLQGAPARQLRRLMINKEQDADMSDDSASDDDSDAVEVDPDL